MSYLLSYKSRMENTLPYASVVIYSVIAMCYGLILSSWPNEYFRDRFNYILYAERFEDIASSYSSASWLVNEPLFLTYNYLLSFLFTPEQVPQVGVFFIASTIAFFILRHAHSYLMIFVGFAFLFFISYTFHLQLVVLRQGIATALLLWIVYFFYKKKYFPILFFLLSFVHVSFFIVFLIVFYEKFLGIFIKDFTLRIILFCTSLFALSFVLLKVASSLGVRQAEGEHLLNNTASGGGFILFAFLFLFFYLRGLNNVENNPYGKIALLGILSYLVFYFTIPVSGRLIATFLPFFYIYVISCTNGKIHFSAYVFLLINLILFAGSITGGSLTNIGSEKFYSIVPF